MTLTSPYSELPASAFWRTGLAEVSYPPPSLYVPRFRLKKQDRIVTAGSCFAQHVGRTLRSNGFNVMDKEPVSEDKRKLGDAAQAHGYGLYTARYGNIYTARQLKQILLEALGRESPADLIWERKGRFFDSMRPNIEPEGFASEDELRSTRKRHLQRVSEAFSEADVFVFTLGLTEAWTHRETGQVYATAPGTIAGRYDPATHVFKNFRHHEIIADLREVLRLLKEINPGLRMLLTVSPVPLTATATGDHVLSATTYSKSVLRACAGELREDHLEVDYFPSFEIITSVRAGSGFFEENLRSVTSDGVALAMKTFVEAHTAAEDTTNSTGLVAESKKQRKQRRAEAEAAPIVVVASTSNANSSSEVAGIAVPESPYSTRRNYLGRTSDLGGEKPEELACAEAVVQAGDRVLEIGARLGIVSAFLAKSRLPGAIRVYESDQDLVPHIRALYALNGVEQKIDLRQATVLPQSIEPKKGGRDKKSADKSVSFPDLIAEFAPKVLLMNLSGEEVDFLLNADLSSLRALAVRWHPKVTPIDDLRKCKRHLKAAGFTVIEPVSTRMTWATTR